MTTSSTLKNNSLLQRVKDGASGRQGGPLMPLCQLQTGRCSCGNTGIRIDGSKVVAVAAICDCVRNCSRCHGKARRIEAGQSRPCREPDPAKLVSLLNSAQIPGKYACSRLSEFKNFGGNGRAVLAQIQTWVTSTLEKPTKGLVIGGPVGVGKTFLLAALSHELLMRGRSVRFVDFFHLLSILRAAYAEGKSDQSVLAPLIAADILVIDELGKGRNTEWEQTVLDSLVMQRYNAGLPILASTNHPLFEEQKKKSQYQFSLEDSAHGSHFSPDAFEPLEERVGKRIYSRLVEMSIFVELNGEDLRRVGPSSQSEPTRRHPPRT